MKGTAMTTVRNLVVGAVVLVGLLIVLPTTCTVIDPGNMGVKVTLGQVTKEAYPPGLRLHAPLITRFKQISVRQETTVAKAECFSKDLQTVNITYAILWRVPDCNVVDIFQKYAGQPFETLIDPRACEILKEQTAQYKAEELVRSREVMKEAVLKKLREKVVSEANKDQPLLVIVDFVVQNIDLTDELEKAIESKQVMEQQALAKQYELLKEEKEAEITMVKAKAEAEAVKIRGEALKESPAVIALEIVKKWNGVAPVYLSTTGGGANIILPVK